MLKRLLTLEWKAFFRSANFEKSLGLKIMMAFLAIYFITIFLLAGIGLYPVITKYIPNEDPLNVVNHYVMLWLLAEIGVRFFLQTLPVLAIKPLLILPIKKRKLVNFVLLKSLFSFFNLLPVMVIVPFGIYNIFKSPHSLAGIILWMVAMTCLSLSMNFVNLIVKKQFTDNLKALLPAGFIVLGLFILDYLAIFEISVYVGKLLNYIILYPLLGLIPVLLLACLYIWNMMDLEGKLFLDSSLKEKIKGANIREFLWTRRFGDLAPYLQHDLKMIWRNKRPKTAVYLSFLLLGYGLIFYPKDIYYEMPAVFVFVGIFMTGIFMINYGQFIPAWDAGYYPLIMSQDIPITRYLMAKAILITGSVVGLTILTTPYLYFGWQIFLLNIVCAVYNIGVNIPILLYAGSFNRKRIDLDKAPFMNYQGTGAAQWLVGIPLMVIPVFFFWVFNKFVSYESAVLVILAMGILGLLLRSHAITFIARIYKRKKYGMIAGFKQQAD
ncbi:DUF5687 family protein [soil metagenome]